MKIVKNVFYVLAFYLFIALPGLLNAWLSTIPFSGEILFIIFAFFFLLFINYLVGGGRK
jgi:hypothetical protein